MMMLNQAHVGDFLGVLHDFGAEGFGFGVGGVDIVDEDVGEPGGGGSGDRCCIMPPPGLSGRHRRV